VGWASVLRGGWGVGIFVGTERVDSGSLGCEWVLNGGSLPCLCCVFFVSCVVFGPIWSISGELYTVIIESKQYLMEL